MLILILHTRRIGVEESRGDTVCSKKPLKHCLSPTHEEENVSRGQIRKDWNPGSLYVPRQEQLLCQTLAEIKKDAHMRAPFSSQCSSGNSLNSSLLMGEIRWG